MTIAKASADYKLPEPGLNRARCVQLIELGTQHNDMFGKWAPKVQLGFELCDQRITVDENGHEVERPMMISKEFTLSLNSKAELRKMLECWRNKQFTTEELKGFDLSKILGHPCYVALSIQQKKQGDGRYARIDGLNPPPAAMVKEWPTTCHDILHYEVSGGQNDLFRSLPEWIQNKILACQEWRQQGQQDNPPPNTHDGGEGDSPIDDEDVPF